MSVIQIKYIVSAVAAASAVLGSAAHAQSSATLYGEFDAGLAYVSNVGGNAQVKATAGLIDGGFWGLQGEESLGDNLKAVFRLERGFSVLTGEGFNDHPMYMGLSSETFGMVSLGHQYDSMHDYFAPFVLTGGAGGTAFAHPFDNDNANNSYLARNSIKYTSPSFGGFSFGGMYALSNDAASFANNRAYSVGANFQSGPFSAGAGYLHVSGRGNTSSGAYDSVSLPGTHSDIFDVNVASQNTYGLGMSYVFDDVTLSAAWSRSTFSSVVDASSGAPVPTEAFNNYEINGVYQLNPLFALAGVYNYTSGTTAHWHEAAVQLDYLMSKRTDLYFETVYQRASSGAPAVINTTEPSSNRNQLLLAVGIRHRF
ncbi:MULTISPECIES: porin [unclassified Caballeronia]|uniref:porin n=1 Tax=unclassified Caballeronia TaxID=2646786 RepID=UPI002028B1F3|nr:MULTISPECIES: porin [unclassified Caballeronia]